MQPLASSPKCPSAVGEFVRYLRIAWTDSSVSAATCSGGTGGYINLQELQLIYNGYNVALGKPGTALDVWSNAYVRSNLVDGKSTMYHSLTQSSSTYVQIDLQVRGLWCGLPGAPCHHLLPGCCCRAAAVAGLLLPGCCCRAAAVAGLLLPGCCCQAAAARLLPCSCLPACGILCHLSSSAHRKHPCTVSRAPCSRQCRSLIAS